MFYVVPTSFNPLPYLTIPITQVDLDCAGIQFYDKDGFELTPLEIAYYKSNHIPMNDYLYNMCCQQPWILPTIKFGEGLSLDHSMILERYGFAGQAILQLNEARKLRPAILKILSTRRKWGIDFSLDYIMDDEVTDVFHIEIDSYSYDEILDVKACAEQVILNTDWVDGAKAIRRTKSEWAHLEGHEQSNWKAKFFGFRAAEHICKAI